MSRRWRSAWFWGHVIAYGLTFVVGAMYATWRGCEP